MKISLSFELNSRPGRDGLHVIRLRVTQNRKLIRVDTGLRVDKSCWNSKGGPTKENWVSKKSDNSFIVNTGLKSRLRKAELVIEKMKLSDSTLPLDKLKEEIENSWFGDGSLVKKSTKPKLGDVVKELVDIKNKLYRSGGRITENLYNDVLAFNGEDPFLTDLTLSFIERFHAYLGKRTKPTTQHKKMVLFKGIVKSAIDRGLLQPKDNPFNHFHNKRVQVFKNKLSKEQIQSIETLELPKGRLSDARDVFLFQYYTAGTRVGDVLTARWSNLSEDRFTYFMAKTGQPRSIKLSEKARALVEKYRAITYRQDRDTWIFPWLKEGLSPEHVKSHYKDVIGSATTLINRNLKKLAERCGIPFNLTSHIARHTFADHVRRKTGDVYLVSKALGHSSLAVTEAYLKSLDVGAVDAAIDALND